MIGMLSNYMILITMPTNVYVTMSTMMMELVTVNTLIVGMMLKVLSMIAMMY